MIDKQQRLQNRLGPEIEAFRETCQSLQLATLNGAVPHASYSPFAYTQEGYFILVSDIAQHGQNLKNAPLVSIMMIEDEAKAKSIHARRRLNFDTKANHIDKSSVLGERGLNALESRFGKIIAQLSALADFNLYQLIPIKGRYVKGFGQAFDISADQLLSPTHLTKGHSKEQN